MKEIKCIIEAYDKLSKSGQKMALATVVNVEESSYRRSGARMLIMEDGSWIGGISGGCLEGDTLKKAQFVMFENKALTVRYDTRKDDPNQIGVGLGCNGLIDVLIAPIDHNDKNNNVALLRNEIEKRTAAILVTVVRGDNALPTGKLIVAHRDNDLEGFLKNDVLAHRVTEDIKSVRSKRRSKTVSYDSFNFSISLFIEYLPPRIHLYIFGKNYDAIPLSILAKEIGWKVSIVANPIKVSKNLFEKSDAVISPKTAQFHFDGYSAVLLMSHDYQTDKENFANLIDEKLNYIGLLGPRSRSEKIFSELKSSGKSFSEDNVFAPIGIDTGATSPEEIAISMIAEIRAHFSNRSGGFLRKRPNRINEDD